MHVMKYLHCHYHMDTCGIRINAKLVKEVSFCINAIFVKGRVKHPYAMVGPSGIQTFLAKNILPFLTSIREPLGIYSSLPESTPPPPPAFLYNVIVTESTPLSCQNNCAYSRRRIYRAYISSLGMFSVLGL